MCMLSIRTYVEAIFIEKKIFMKLLLTSAGFTNDSIKGALFDLVGKKPEETTVVLIPTAMNMEQGGKEWHVRGLNGLLKSGIKELDIVDISALPKDVWLDRLRLADVICCEGGNTTHLVYHMEKSGFINELPKLLESKVYMGISAGSIATNPSLVFSNPIDKQKHHEIFHHNTEQALGLVNFYITPHFNSSYFPEYTKEALSKKVLLVNEIVYAIDDNTAIKVDGDEIEVISEGEYEIFNNFTN